MTWETHSLPQTCSEVTPSLVHQIAREEVGRLRQAGGYTRLEEASGLFERVALEGDFIEFLTLPASEMID